MDGSQEYAALKMEQLERIKQPDNFLNLNVAALAVATAIATQGAENGLIWLAVPWIALILGWAYLSNDDKVSAIATHLRSTSDPNNAIGEWESSEKGFIPRGLRRVAESSVFMVSFIFPCPVALALFLAGRAPTSRAASLGLTVISLIELLTALGLAALYVAHSALGAGRALWSRRVRFPSVALLELLD